MRFSARFAASIALCAIALVETAYGLWFGPTVAALIAVDPARTGWLGPVIGGIAGLAISGLGLGLGLLTAGSAIGVGIGHPAGWWAAMISSCLWALTGCAPAAALSIGVLLLPGVRAIAFPPASEAR